MKSDIHFLTLILFVLLLFSGCGKSDSPTSSAIGTGSVDWVGSEMIFNSIDGKKEYSILFFYADWCGYCHKMDEITFTTATVTTIMNQYFNNVRVNAESDSLLVHFDSTVTGRQMKTIYEVNGYPSIRIFKGDGEYLTSVVGYTNPADFAAGLNRVLSGEYE